MMANQSDNQTPAHPHIRWMIRRDMPEVLALENEAFEFPWCEDDFIRRLRQRNCIGMIIECREAGLPVLEAGKLVGYMVYELHKTRLHLLNFAVHRDWRRRGMGRLMVDKLVGKLSPERRTKVSIEVRETNLDAQLFFKAMGFECVNVLRDYYGPYTTEDAYLFQYRIRERSMQYA